MLSPAQLDELCLRSSKGEGVRTVLAEFGCDTMECLLWLQKNAHGRLVAAKRAYNEGVPLVEAPAAGDAP